MNPAKKRKRINQVETDKKYIFHEHINVRVPCSPLDLYRVGIDICLQKMLYKNLLRVIPIFNKEVNISSKANFWKNIRTP